MRRDSFSDPSGQMVVESSIGTSVQYKPSLLQLQNECDDGDDNNMHLTSQMIPCTIHKSLKFKQLAFYPLATGNGLPFAYWEKS